MAKNTAKDNPEIEKPENSIPAESDLVGGFSLESLRIDPQTDLLSTARVYTRFTVTKPPREEFVRVHPIHRVSVLLFEDGLTRQHFLINPKVIPLARCEIPGRRVELRLCIPRGRDPILWPIGLPPVDGKNENSWTESARVAAIEAEGQWVRIASNQASGRYDLTVATASIPEPDWNALPPFHEILDIAFKDRIVSDPEHLILRRLRGEV